MKRIILQHWSGPSTELEQRSWASIKAYAARVGAEHAVVSGTPLGKFKFPHMQKLYMLHEAHDAFDTVVMMDSDMFAMPHTPNIFAVPGIGVCGPLQESLRGSLRFRASSAFFGMAMGDYYGGALYKLERGDRINFRRHLTKHILRKFDATDLNLDEGAMHYLACATRTAGRALPGGERWACSSFDPAVASAHLVHVRRRIAPGKEDRRDKIENLQALVGAGVLAA